MKALLGVVMLALSMWDMKVLATSSLCTSITCPSACEFGFLRDSNGCKTCTCLPKCITCANYCEHGHVIGADGCPTCVCNSAAVCPSYLACSRPCKYGYIVDGHGCPTCECIKPDCPPFQCNLDCPGGYMQSIYDGCPYCRCRYECPPNCMVYCEYGYVPGVHGCPTCRCMPAPGGCHHHAHPYCPIFCKYGYSEDGNGCKLCECREHNLCIGIPVCKLYCEFGWAVDEDGCEICKCNERPNPWCRKLLHEHYGCINIRVIVKCKHHCGWSVKQLAADCVVDGFKVTLTCLHPCLEDHCRDPRCPLRPQNKNAGSCQYLGSTKCSEHCGIGGMEDIYVCPEDSGALTQPLRCAYQCCCKSCGAHGLIPGIPCGSVDTPGSAC